MNRFDDFNKVEREVLEWALLVYEPKLRISAARASARGKRDEEQHFRDRIAALQKMEKELKGKP